MALQSADFQKLSFSLDDLTKASRDLLGQMLKEQSSHIVETHAMEARGVGSYGNGSGAGGSSGGGGAPSAGSGKASASDGVGLGFVKSLEQGGGALAAAGFSVAKGIMKDANSVLGAYSEAYSGAPTSDSQGMAETRARAATRGAILDVENTRDLNNLANYANPTDINDMVERAKGRAAEKREYAVSAADELEPQQRALAATKDIFRGAARAGAFTGTDQQTEGMHKAFRQILGIQMKFAQGQQDMEKFSRIANAITDGGAPGVNSRFNTK